MKRAELSPAYIPINREQTALGNEIGPLIKEIGECASTIVFGDPSALEECQIILRTNSGYEQGPNPDNPEKARTRWTPSSLEKVVGVHAYQPFAFFELICDSASSKSVNGVGYKAFMTRLANMRRGKETTPFFDEESPFSLQYMQPIRIDADTQFELLGHLESIIAETKASRANPFPYFDYSNNLFVGLRFHVEKPGQMQVILMQQAREGKIRSRVFSISGMIPVVYNDYEKNETAKHSYFYPEDVLVLNYILDAMRRHIYLSSVKIPQPGSSSDG